MRLKVPNIRHLRVFRRVAQCHSVSAAAEKEHLSQPAVTQAISKLLEDELTAIVVKPDVMQRYHEKLQNRMRYTSWTSGCQSWYLDEHGENHTLFPGLATEYALSMRRFKLGEYEVVR